MIERERKDKNLITCKEDILDRYPNLFTYYSLDKKRSLYIENPNPVKPGLFRFMILPAGVVAVSSLKKDSIWDIENYRFRVGLIDTIDDIVKEKNESGTKYIPNLVQELHYETEEYFLRILPYSDRHSSDVITCILDTRYEDIQNQLPLTQI
jgi:hypothetical protein